MNRWPFFLSLVIVFLVVKLEQHFSLFFDPEISSEMGFPLTIVVIIWFMFFKRALDIFDKWWKGLICSLLPVMIGCCLEFFVSYNRFVDRVFTVFFVIFFLFLVFKGGKSGKFVWERKIVFKRLGVLALTFGIFAFLRFSYASELFGGSQSYPTLGFGDGVLVSKLVRFHALDRGDLVVPGKYGEYERNALRIIGLPNEEIKLDGQKIYINGKLFDDKFAFYSPYLEPIDFQETVRLDKDSYFLMGDNRYFDKGGKIFARKKDSEEREWRAITPKNRIYLVVKRNKLYGKVVAVHYESHKEYNKQHPEEQVQRKFRSYAFAGRNKKFGFNPRPFEEKLFGKP